MKKFYTIIILLVCVCLIGAGSFVYFAYKAKATGTGAASFPGSGKITTPGGFNFYDSSFSAAAWFKGSAGSNGYGTVVGRFDGSNAANTQWAILNSVGGDNKFHFQISNGTQIDIAEPTAHSTNTWHLVVATWDASTGAMTLYVDDQTPVTGNNSAPLQNPAITETIGNSQANSLPCNGSIDEVLLFSKVLTPTQVATLWNSGAGAYGNISADPWNSNLEAAYHLDELAGHNFADFSGNNRTATAVVISRTEGKIPVPPLPQTSGALRIKSLVLSTAGQAASFDGSNYITASDASLPSGNSARSISFWAYPTAVDGSYHCAFKYGTMSGTHAVTLYIKNQNYWFFSQHGGEVSGGLNGPPAVVNQWVFMVATYDGTYWRLYQDGVLTATSNAYATDTLLSDLKIGSDGTYGFKGKIEEVQVYNTALTGPSDNCVSHPDNQICALYNAGVGACGTSGNNLVAGYHLDGAYNDYSVNGNNGTQTGGVTFVASDKSVCVPIGGKLRIKSLIPSPQALSLDGTQTVSPTNNISGSNYTFSFWYNDVESLTSCLNGGTDGSGCSLLSFSNGTGEGGFVFGNIYGDEVIGIPGNGVVSGCANFPSGWNHYAVTYDSSGSVTIYVNGVANGCIFEMDSTAISSGSLILGSDTSYDLSFLYSNISGLIDDVQVYSRILSDGSVDPDDNEILDLYNAGAGSCGTGSESGLVAGYHFDGNLNDYLGSNTAVLSGGTTSFVASTKAVCTGGTPGAGKLRIKSSQ